MKKSIGAENCLYPTPSVIVSADINGKISMYGPAYWSLGEQIGKAWSIGKDFLG